MQYINHWPDMAELALPEAVAQDLYEQLLEPFDSEEEAKSFWEEAPSTIIILDHGDSIDNLKQDPAWSQIEFALTYPEYILPLSMEYQLLVTIANDSGSAFYLIIPPQLSSIINEVNNP